MSTQNSEDGAAAHPDTNAETDPAWKRVSNETITDEILIQC